MDILSQYKKDNPAYLQSAPVPSFSQGNGFFSRLVIRLSGGKIQSERQANIFLAAGAVIILSISLILFLRQGKDTHVSSERIMLPPGPPLMIPSPAP